MSAAVGTASMIDVGLGEGEVVGAGDLAREAARRGAVVEVDQAALGGLAQHRRQRRLGGGEARAHEIGDADIALEAAHQPVQAVDVLAGLERGEQRLRARIVVGIVERLHRHLQQDLVAFAARASGICSEIAAVGREGERHRSRQLAERVGGAARADAEPADHDRDRAAHSACRDAP